MQLLQQLKGVQVDGLQLDEAVLLLAIAGKMDEAYQQTVGEAPQWLTDARETLQKEVKSRSQDALEKRLKELEAQEDRLKSAQEKREDIAKERARIEAKLGKAPEAGA